jgi:hypothetical protein
LLSAVVACALCVGGCASTTYRPFESRSDGIVNGKGGTQTVQEGMEVWNNGDPPRRYKVLGFIDDERPGDAKSMSRLFGDVVKQAREVGGQALIQVRSQSQVTGYQSTDSAPAQAYGGSTSPGMATAAAVPVRKHKAQFMVVRYLD